MSNFYRDTEAPLTTVKNKLVSEHTFNYEFDKCIESLREQINKEQLTVEENLDQFSKTYTNFKEIVITCIPAKLYPRVLEICLFIMKNVKLADITKGGISRSKLQKTVISRVIDICDLAIMVFKARKLIEMIYNYYKFDDVLKEQIKTTFGKTSLRQLQKNLKLEEPINVDTTYLLIDHRLSLLQNIELQQRDSGGWW
jgi:hypothetical protein